MGDLTRGYVIRGYISAVVTSYILGAICISQVNLASLAGMGVEINLAIRLDAAWHDVTHMYFRYLPAVAVAFVAALPVAAAIIRWLPRLRLIGYVCAGFVGLLCAHLVTNAVLGYSGIAATRTFTGLLTQGFAGAAGGFVFFLMTSNKPLHQSG